MSQVYAGFQLMTIIKRKKQIREKGAGKSNCNKQTSACLSSSATFPLTSGSLQIVPTMYLPIVSKMHCAHSTHNLLYQ